jgi:hypothetical protein
MGSSGPRHTLPARARLLVVGAALALAAAPSACSLLTDLSGYSSGEPGALEGGAGGDGAAADGASLDGALGDGAAADGASLDGGSAYAQAVLADSPLAYYPFDEAAGTVAHDVVGGKDAFVVSASLGAKGRVGTAVALDGASSRIELPAGAFVFAGRAPFSLEVWLDPQTVDTTVRRVAHRGTPTAGGGWELYFTSNYLQTKRSDGDGGTDSYASTDGPAAGLFAHVVMTYDGAQMRLYVNGVLRSTANGSLNVPNSPDARLVFGDLVQPAYYKLHGVLDEIAIYDHPLSAARIAAHLAAAGP